MVMFAGTLTPILAFSQTLPGSFVANIQAQHSGFCLTVHRNARPGSPLQQRTCRPSWRTQRFIFTPVAGKNNIYTLRNEYVNLCLDESRGKFLNQYDGRPEVNFWTCHGNSNQQFELADNHGNGVLLRTPAGECVDIAGASGARDASVISYACHGRENQRFAINKIGGPGPDNPPPPNPDPDPPKPDNLPEGSAGSGQLLLVNRAFTNRGPEAADVASFRLDCEFSHMNYDDVIVKPGQPGEAHLHQYYGNTDVDAFSTNNSIINSGNSTCAGGIANRSAYWVPAMIDSRTNKPIKPGRGTMYYKTGFWGTFPQNSVAPPNGLRIIAGDATESGPEANKYASKTEFFCTAPNDLAGPFNSGQALPTDCSAGDILRMRVAFPNCWDGRNLDSADHKSHMAYSRDFGGSLNNRTGCPASHPVQIPTMTINADWPVRNPADVRHWRLSSDMYDRSIPAGYSAHGDWIVGWDEQIFNRMLDGCHTPATDCAHNNLNDGQGLQSVR